MREWGEKKGVKENFKLNGYGRRVRHNTSVAFGCVLIQHVFITLYTA